MATLTVWQFDTADGAGRGRRARALALDGGVVVHDAAARRAGRPAPGRPRTRQLDRPGTAGALGSGFWGLLFGLIFFVPLLGAAMGATTGALAGALADVGIDDHFINRVRDQVTPGTSALFLLTSDAVSRPAPRRARCRTAPRADRHRPRPDQEAALRAVFGD